MSSITLHFVSFILRVIFCKQPAALGLALYGGVMITVQAVQLCVFIKEGGTQMAGAEHQTQAIIV